MMNPSRVKSELLSILYKSTLTPVLTTYYSPALGRQVTRLIPKNLSNDPNGHPAHGPKGVDADALKYHNICPAAKKASQASKDKVAEISSHFDKDDKQGLMDAIAGMGFNVGAFNKDWTTSYESNPGIKFMRAKEALSLHAEDGADVVGMFHEYQKSKQSTAPSPTKQPSLVSKVATAVKNAVSKVTGKVFANITDSNMFFLGSPRFRSDLSTPDSPHYKWWKSLTKFEIKCISAYTKHSRDLNMWLRGLHKPRGMMHSLWEWGSIPERERLMRQTKDMDNAIDKAELPEDITVWRVMDIGDNPHLLDQILKKSKSGDFLTDDAFRSSSTLKVVDKSLVDHFQTKLSKFIMLKIRIPKGKGRGAYIAPFSQPQYIKQCEYLIGRGSQLKVDPNYTMVSRSEFVEGATETEKNSYCFECTLEGFDRKDLDLLKSLPSDELLSSGKSVPEPIERFMTDELVWTTQKERDRRRKDPSYRVIDC